jgi:hypothetical protein
MNLSQEHDRRGIVADDRDATAKELIREKLTTAGYDPKRFNVVRKANDVWLATITFGEDNVEHHGIFTAEDLGLV